MKAEAPLDDNEKRRLVLKLISQLHCLECGRAHDRDDFSLVQRWDDFWVLSSHCHHCQWQGHIVVYMHLDAEPGPVTDLSVEELGSTKNRPAINADDVLDVYLFLREFDGDFEELFAR